MTCQAAVLPPVTSQTKSPEPNHQILSSPKMLQEKLDYLQDWERAFRPTKYKVIRYTKKRKPTHENYTINGHIPVIATSDKYLGVTLSENLSWIKHVDAVIKKAYNSSAFLRRNIASYPRTTKAQCYETLFRPTQEYASSVFGPIYAEQGSRSSSTKSRPLCCSRRLPTPKQSKSDD